MDQVVLVLDVAESKLIDAEILSAEKKDLPLKKDGWHFNWCQLPKNGKAQSFILQIINAKNEVEGALHLKLNTKC